MRPHSVRRKGRASIAHSPALRGMESYRQEAAKQSSEELVVVLGDDAIEHDGSEALHVVRIPAFE